MGELWGSLGVLWCIMICDRSRPDHLHQRQWSFSPDHLVVYENTIRRVETVPSLTNVQFVPCLPQPLEFVFSELH
jgi:hypothetical protein